MVVMMSTTGLLFDVHNMVDTNGLVAPPDEQKSALLIQPHVPYVSLKRLQHIKHASLQSYERMVSRSID